MDAKSMESAPQNHELSEALEQVSEEGTKLLDGDSAARERLIASARELIAAAETPVETLLRNIWARVSHIPMFRWFRTKLIEFSPHEVSLSGSQLI
jgi:hypothetical protein